MSHVQNLSREAVMKNSEMVKESHGFCFVSLEPCIEYSERLLVSPLGVFISVLLLDHK